MVVNMEKYLLNIAKNGFNLQLKLNQSLLCSLQRIAEYTLHIRIIEYRLSFKLDCSIESDGN